MKIKPFGVIVFTFVLFSLGSGNQCPEELPEKFENYAIFESVSDCPLARGRLVDKWFYNLNDTHPIIELGQYGKEIMDFSFIVDALIHVSRGYDVVIMEEAKSIYHVQDIRNFSYARLVLKTYECSRDSDVFYLNASKINLQCDSASSILGRGLSPCVNGPLSAEKIYLIQNAINADRNLFRACYGKIFSSGSANFLWTYEVKDWNDIYIKNGKDYCDYKAEKNVNPISRISECNFSLDEQNQIIDYEFFLDPQELNRYWDSRKIELLDNYHVLANDSFFKMRKELVDKHQITSWIEIQGVHYEKITYNQRDYGDSVPSKEWYRAKPKFSKSECSNLWRKVNPVNFEETLHDILRYSCPDIEKHNPELEKNILQKLIEHLRYFNDAKDSEKKEYNVANIDNLIYEYNYGGPGVLVLENNGEFLMSAQNYSSGLLKVNFVDEM